MAAVGNSLMKSHKQSFHAHYKTLRQSVYCRIFSFSLKMFVNLTTFYSTFFYYFHKIAFLTFFIIGINFFFTSMGSTEGPIPHQQRGPMVVPQRGSVHRQLSNWPQWSSNEIPATFADLIQSAVII